MILFFSIVENLKIFPQFLHVCYSKNPDLSKWYIRKVEAHEYFKDREKVHTSKCNYSESKYFVRKAVGASVQNFAIGLTLEAIGSNANYNVL